jgi:alanyl-tRNA synthetase
MQFDMQPDGSVKKLPAPCVDTGMGLERLAAILQHVHSNYEIDLFKALIAAAAREAGTRDLQNASLRVIADHIRAAAFLISDGVIPSNEGRGYVLRRIIRRAIRHGYKVGRKTPFFHKLVRDLVIQMGAAYPRLAEQETAITEVLRAEEERFFETLEHGMHILDAALADGTKLLAGDIAFKLHDTYGFPLDLTQDVCRERGVGVDTAGFDAAMDRQKNQARAAGKFKMDRALDYAGESNRFTGYDDLDGEAKVLALYAEGEPVQMLRAGQSGIVVLDQTPFYAESGGQVGDAGSLVAHGVEFSVTDTQKIKADVFGHHGAVVSGQVSVGDAVRTQVDTARRASTMRHHSATHLMHKALREVLGGHVQQKGSLVTPERTRFDFAHNLPLTQEQVDEIERRVNAEILTNQATQARVMDIESAKQTGAMMLFGEKYGDSVRVLDIGSSRELCGGTHVARTGDIGLFKVVGEGGVAAGVRRIEAVAGNLALAYLQSLENTVRESASALRAAPAEVPMRIGQLQEQLRSLEKEVGALKSQLASGQGNELGSRAVDIKGAKVLAAELPGTDAKALRETLDQLKNKLKSAVIVLASVQGADKVQIAAGVTSDLMAKVPAGELVTHVASQVGGKGGGKADMAMAGGNQPGALAGALASVQAWVAARL